MHETLNSQFGWSSVDEAPKHVWLFGIASAALHIGLFIAIFNHSAQVVAPAAPEKLKIRIFANPNGSDSSKATAAVVTPPKPIVKKEITPLPTPQPVLVPSTKPSPVIQKVQETQTAQAPTEAAPRSFGDDATGGSIGVGVSNSSDEFDPTIISNLEPIERTEPIYPKEARMEGVEGYVVFKFDINEDGSIDNVETVEANSRVFIQASRKALNRWKYKPLTINGKPQKVKGKTVRIVFKLDGATKAG